MAFKMKGFSGFKAIKDKEKHAGGVVGGKTKKGEITTSVKSVAVKRIKAMNLDPEMEAKAIKELTSSMAG